MKVRLADRKMKLELDVTELNQAQIRLIKRINSLVANVLSTDQESDFFESSSEAMKIIATCIKKSNFATEYTESEKIPYGEQALEFSLDELAEEIYKETIIPLDN